MNFSTSSSNLPDARPPVLMTEILRPGTHSNSAASNMDTDQVLPARRKVWISTSERSSSKPMDLSTRSCTRGQSRSP